MRTARTTIGIDEVGRGSLAGPVTVAALALTRRHRFKNLRDSKKLSPQKRVNWYRSIKGKEGIYYSLASVTPKIIDRINIREATNLAASRALRKLISRNPHLENQPLTVSLDGGLFLRDGWFGEKIRARTIIKGDEKINTIKLASIVAKVSRDRYMRQLHRFYPQYSLKENKGYGTKKHFAAILRYGHAKIHRLTFIRKITKV
ncbi:MAG: ribonuclease HII [Patescibacteria group bacterium]